MPATPPDRSLPTGTVTFLFSDIQGSTRLLHELGDGYMEVLAQHRRVLRAAFAAHDGVELGTEGDSFFVAFARASDALAAASEGQCGLEGGPVQVRMGLHAGEPWITAEGYVGMVVHRAARIAAAGHGGQVLLSQTVADLVGGHLPSEVALRDLGSVRLKDLTKPERLYQVLHRQLREDFPPLRSLESTPNNLAQQLTSFVGRDRELADVKNLLARARLATLLGAGGLGKTRLSMHVAVDVLDNFSDGVWLVELAPLADARLLAQAVASVLGVKEESGRPVTEALLKFVKDRQLLLVLDNCEHLLDACAKLAKQLLQAGPAVKILATSREPLHVAGEATFQVPPLSVPEPRSRIALAALTQYEAIRLFFDRAAAAQPAFRLTPNNASTVVDICHRLEGIPLALELAAARVRALSVQTIAERLSDRFRLLTGGDRTELPRHQTLRACIDWSYDLLTEPERAVLRRLAVFAGGWTLDAAEAVGRDRDVEAHDVLNLLTQLVEKSLVAMEAESGRYRLLESVRQYLREKLEERGDLDVIRDRHRSYFLALAEEADPKLIGAEQAEWLQRLDEEYENLRAGLEWSLATAGASEGLRLCGALQQYWWTRGHISEGREWCEHVLGRPGAEERTETRAMALNAAGVLANHQGDFASARKFHEASLAIRRHLGDGNCIAASLNNLGNVAYFDGDCAAARVLFEEALVLRRQSGNRWGIATSLNNLGNLSFEQGEFAAARLLYAESVAIKRELGNRRAIATSLANLGAAALELGEFASARTQYAESLAIKRELGARQGFPDSLEGIAAAVAALGGYLRAARIWSASERLRAEIGLPLPPPDRSRYDRSVAAARTALGDDAAFDDAWQEGRALPIEQAMHLALDETVER